jgi:hypothetical protein
METFCLPWHEIEERFTRSEIVLMGWRSSEQAYNWKRKLKSKPHMEEYSNDNETVRSQAGKFRKNYDGIGPEKMPDEFFAQQTIKDERGRVIAHEGDFNLGQVKGEQARRYMESLGIPLPPGISKVGTSHDETSEQIRKAYGIRR